jgi:hypothetical protein
MSVHPAPRHEPAASFHNRSFQPISLDLRNIKDSTGILYQVNVCVFSMVWQAVNICNQV